MHTQVRDFSKLKPILDIPNLLEIQRGSYGEFLQLDVPPEKRKNRGLQSIFTGVFPIENINENLKLEFVKYSFGEPKYKNVLEFQERDMTYGVPLKLTMRLTVYEKNARGDRTVKEVKEQEIYLCELPLMTECGTFIINGAERVVVSQLHRSPGVSFDSDEGKTLATGQNLFSARISPHRGSWLEFEFDANEVMYVRIDRRKKVVATVILRAFGYATNREILGLFHKFEKVKLADVKPEKIIGRILACDVINDDTREVLAKSNDKITESVLNALSLAKIKTIEILNDDEGRASRIIHRTLLKDNLRSREEALLEIYRRMRPGQPPTIESAETFFNNLFINPKRYDLGEVGRYKLNKKLKMDFDELKEIREQEIKNRRGRNTKDQYVKFREDDRDFKTLYSIDVVRTIFYLIGLNEGRSDIAVKDVAFKIEKDDIDHLGNRRVRRPGELLKDQFRIGMARMEKAIRERISIVDVSDVMPSMLINGRPLEAAINEFFRSSPLSQFMDQTNPLAELTHKRRLSALGPGGLTRERAGFEVRDVHHTHYGRICPIETPEGPNIGLIASLSTYAQVNRLGFVETPYRKVVNGRVTEQIEYLTADAEDEYVIAQANSRLDQNGRFEDKLILSRYRGNFPMVSPEKIHYMDISPMQLFSVATVLIPFLEHDDANRALMGSNMQRQGVPLLMPEQPLIKTGIESRAARDSGAVLSAEKSGVVEYVDANEIMIAGESREPDKYSLIKYKRSNQDTCINYMPIVKKDQKVKQGQVIADGPATRDGELALGINVLAAFMPWEGYNFEDAILISEKLLKDDRLTSIHIEEYQMEARDTKLGKEEITRDIPNVSEEALRNLDEGGIIRIGAEVEPGDILVGKITPKGETELTPEEKLLRAIFGEKAGEVRDTSLRALSGVEGKVINVKIFSRKEKSGRAAEAEKKKIEKEKKRTIEILKEQNKEELAQIKAARTLELKAVKRDSAKKKAIKGEYENKLRLQKERFKEKLAELEENHRKKLDRLERGDELAPGVINLIKVYIARIRKISVGDKLAGRHGNKGVVAKILPEEDMPFLPDGTPVEVVLNPLGVPSRMNVGQILETHLGWAAHVMGYKVVSAIFSGATEQEIKEALKEAKLPESGRTMLYDGRTGEKFANEVTVGSIYMMKLAHLVEDKIHARSIGPYSLITQQPLGGKAQFGGQRFGEMEVWALEAYGAANTLQEMLTVKSDDVSGRTKLYESLVKGKNAPVPGIPESFNVLIKELQSLCMNVDFLTGDELRRLESKRKEK